MRPTWVNNFEEAKFLFEDSNFERLNISSTRPTWPESSDRLSISLRMLDFKRLISLSLSDRTWLTNFEKAKYVLEKANFEKANYFLQKPNLTDNFEKANYFLQKRNLSHQIWKGKLLPSKAKL